SGSQWNNRQTSPVDLFKPNAFGLYDMAGNVWQWVQDCYHGDYNGAPTDGSAWTSGDCGRRVYRGGSWYSLPRYLRSANRSQNATSYRVNLVGFRVGRSLSDAVTTEPARHNILARFERVETEGLAGAIAQQQAFADRPPVPVRDVGRIRQERP